MSGTKRIDYADELENFISRLVIGNSKNITVDTLARVAGKSTSLVYKAASPNDETPFPVSWLPAFMNIKDDYEVLNLLCVLTGHLPPVRVPKFKLLKEDEIKVINSFNKTVNRLSEAFSDHLDEPDNISFKEYKRLAEDTIKIILSSICYAQKAISGQGEFNL
jgi:hypothetical protein